MGNRMRVIAQRIDVGRERTFGIGLTLAVDFFVIWGKVIARS